MRGPHFRDDFAHRGHHSPLALQCECRDHCCGPPPDVLVSIAGRGGIGRRRKRRPRVTILDGLELRVLEEFMQRRALRSVCEPKVAGRSLGFILRSALLLFATTSALAQAPASRPSFEVASIKPSANGTARTMVGTRAPGTFTAQNSNVRNLIAAAYDVKLLHILGGPTWIDRDRYDVNAALGWPADARKTTSVPKWQRCSSGGACRCCRPRRG